jgi:hypothetical protein
MPSAKICPAIFSVKKLLQRLLAEDHRLPQQQVWDRIQLKAPG